MTQRNRRKHGRTPSKGIATHYRSGAAMALAMPVDNISAGGMFVRTEEFLPIGSQISIELLDGAPNDPLKLTGRVVGHVTPWQAKTLGRVAGMGVRFEGLTDEATERLEQLIVALHNREKAAPLVTQDVEATRKTAFDFGFASLEGYVAEQEEEDFAAFRAQREQAKSAFTVPPPPPEPEPKAKPRAEPPPAAPTPSPAQVQVVVPAPKDQVAVPQDGKLMVQVRGLLLDLNDLHARLRATERENEKLKERVQQLEAELAKARGKR